MMPLDFNQFIEYFNFSLLFLIPLFILKNNKSIKGKYFFPIISAMFVLFFREKHFIYLVFFMSITLAQGLILIAKKSKKLAIISFLIISLYYSHAFFSNSQSIAWERPTSEMIEAYLWINQYSPKNATVFDCINHGAEVLAYAQRKNAGDNFFEFIGDLPITVENDYMELMASFDLITPKSIFNKYGANYFVYFKDINDSCYWWVNESEKALFPKYFENQEFTPFMFKAYNKQVPYLKTVYENEKAIVFEII
jgi:hypothetical protein